ncbi:MAG TPA: DoxX family protein [Xanthobacteraceae bacterium]|jgi:putative oxidoreductase|nr:DoxX family protein [Xanthobacteraceae bacterium]
MDAVEKFVPVLGRFLLALIFVFGGYNKLSTIGATSAQMTGHGIPFAGLLIYGVIALELGGGLMLMFGLLTRWVGLALFLYLISLAVIFHPYWAMPLEQVREQRASFFGHVAMMGGMLYVFAYGGGAYSLDALLGMGRPRTAAAVA